MPSPSLSDLQPSVPIWFSSTSLSRSLSSSASAEFGTPSLSQSASGACRAGTGVGVAAGAPSELPAGVPPSPGAGASAVLDGFGAIVGESRLLVKFLPKREDRIRRWNFAAPAPSWLCRRDGTLTYIRRSVETSALTKITARPSRLKPTLLRPLPLRKYLPVILSVSPTVAFIGEIAVMTGDFAF